VSCRKEGRPNDSRILDVEALITRKSNKGFNFGFKMLAKLSAEPLLSQSYQEEVLCCPCIHDSLLEQNMFFCQDILLSSFPPSLTLFT